MKQFLAMALAAILAGAGGGYGAARMFPGPGPAPQTQPAPDPAAAGGAEPAAGGKELAYHDFEMKPVTINEPRLNRVVKSTFTLAFDAKDKQAVVGEVTKKDPNLRNWLTAYLANCTLDDLRGKKNLNRIRREVHEEFNRRLWPDSTSLIQEVLLKEFIIQ